jgi:L1 cell adhesion molecule like protein
MHGFGVYIYANKERYEGEFSDDKKEGFGVYNWNDGRKYEGWWHSGK